MAKWNVKESKKSRPRVIFIEGRVVTKNIKAEIRRALLEALVDVSMKKKPKGKTTKKLRKFRKELEEARKRLSERRRKYANPERGGPW